MPPTDRKVSHHLINAAHGHETKIVTVIQSWDTIIAVKFRMMILGQFWGILSSNLLAMIMNLLLSDEP